MRALRGDLEQRVEPGVELVGVAAQRGVGQVVAAARDGAGVLQERVHARRESSVACIDGVLHVADEMGEADLMFDLGPIHLRGGSVVDDLVRRRVAVIVPVGDNIAAAVKAATATVPIVFGVYNDPVALGLVASLAQPRGNATGFNFYNGELAAKRLGLLHQLVPKAVRVAVLLNPANATTAKTTLRDAQEAAATLGLQVQFLNASTSNEIDAAFAALVRERADALMLASDGFFNIRRVQLANLAARDRIPVAYTGRGDVAAGGLMSYGVAATDMYREMGVYTGMILKGAKPADLPVVQPTRFEFVINSQTAKTIGLEIPPGVLAIADEVIE